MARPEFEVPEFVSESDSDQIQERMMGNLPADISDMEGDFPYDFTMPTAIEISQLVQFNLVRCLMVAFPEYSWGDWMDLHGAEAGVTRKEAVAATGTVSVTAAYGTVLAAGTVFAVPATDQMEAVEFQTLRTVTFAENETMDLAVEAVTPGVSGNVPANTITIMASPINGVTAITNSEKTSGGAEEENDEDYYERIHAEFQDSQFYVANDADYIKWAKEVPGIGDCIVEPAVEGPGTVGLILVDSNGQPASSTLVTAVYNHIVSPDDRSKRLLPTGSSKLIVKSATVKTVDFACTGLVLDGVGLDDVISTFKTEMMAVYSAAKETNILRYNSARTVLSTITGVSDFIDFTMDGKRENIHLSSSEYADTGNVTFPIYQEVLNYNGRSNGMIKILLSKKLGEMRLTQADLARATGIRPNTINELYHELADRVNLEHLDLICEALDCELDELIVRVPNKESAITHTRQGTQKPGRKR